jgi:DNA processing protein
MLTVTTSVIPDRLKHLTPVVATLFTAGGPLHELINMPCLTVVGSRKVTAYGRAVTTSLVSELARAGVVIVSGLAIGVDAIAHKAALDAGGITIAVLPGSIERIYPASHTYIAKHILEQGGALITEYPEGTVTYPQNFIARNRIAAGLGDAVLITEAAQKSGTLHTARFGLEQGKTVLAVPGNITSPTSVGTNNLIKAGAVPVTSAADIFNVLGIQPTVPRVVATGETPAEQLILDLLQQGALDADTLLVKSGLETPNFNQSLTMLEIRGHVRPLGNNIWELSAH